MKGTWLLLPSTPSDLHFGAARGQKLWKILRFMQILSPLLALKL